MRSGGKIQGLTMARFRDTKSGWEIATLVAMLLSMALTTTAEAGIQRWDLVPAPNATKGQSEAIASNQLGFSILIGCAESGGYNISLMPPNDKPGAFAGEAIDPALRISKPGTDLFRGPIGTMTFDGSRYTGHFPDSAAEPLRERLRDGLLTLTEFSTRTIVSLKTAGLDRALAELSCK